MKRDESFALQPQALSAGDVAGKQVAVVGGTGGIGQALSRHLAKLGARVIAVGQTFRDTHVPNIEFMKADLSLMSEARRVAQELPAASLDLVVFTTGIFAAPQRQVSAEGIERDMAISFLSRLVILRDIAQRLGSARTHQRAKARVFVMGYPGTGQTGALGDLNAEQSYKAMGVHMNTVAGNEMLVLDGAKRYTDINVYGLNPGLIKTAIRTNFMGGNKFLFALLEGAIGVVTPSAHVYAQQIAPLLFSNDIERRSGALFNRKGQAIVPSDGMTAAHISAFLAESQALADKALAALPA